MTPYDTNEHQLGHWTDQPMDPAMARLLQTIVEPLQADLDQLSRKVADGAAAPGLSAVRADLASVLEQTRLNSCRLNEELGALGVQLRQQHMDVSDRIMSLQAGIGSQFDAVAAAIATSTSHASSLARASDQLAERQKLLVVDTVQKELALQMLPLQARLRAQNMLLGVSVGLSVGAFVLLVMAALR